MLLSAKKVTGRATAPSFLCIVKSQDISPWSLTGKPRSHDHGICPINKIYNDQKIPHGNRFVVGQIPKVRVSEMSQIGYNLLFSKLHTLRPSQVILTNHKQVREKEDRRYKLLLLSAPYKHLTNSMFIVGLHLFENM